DGTGGDHALGAAPDPEEQVVSRALSGCGDRAGDVAIGNELDPRTGFPHLAYDPRVAGPVDDDDRQVLDGDPLGFGNPPQVLGHRCVDVDAGGRLGTGHDLVHVEARARVEHRAPVG